MNGFVDYLNSTNNIGGNSTGSLAESQVKSPYFDKVKVDRKLGDFIANTVRNNTYKAFIITGHAGDGKTSILVQVLKSLGFLHEGEGLELKHSYSNFFYVKDMSEIAEADQENILADSLNAPLTGKTSLLISNTGPLLKSFLRLVERSRKSRDEKFDSQDRIDLQSKLLSQLDVNAEEEVEIDGHSFYLVNIARLDNVIFSRDILNNILSDELWRECKDCKCKDRCPIFNNVITVRNQKSRVLKFIESFYRFLYENDKRMTIRQMVGQMSYAITGNLSCKYISLHFLKEPFFNYHFANLFFGYKGLNEAKDSSQIKGIEHIKQLELGKKALDVDYRLFVNNDFSFFNPDIAKQLDCLIKSHIKHYQIVEEDGLTASRTKNEMKVRNAIRRFFLVFSSDGQEDNLFNQSFGKSYTLYKKLISSKQSKLILRNIQTLLFKALYIRNTGFLPEDTNDLPLTLRRENGVFQNAMLVLGTVPKNELHIVQKPVHNRFEDVTDKHELYLEVRGRKFYISLPMLLYFDDLIDGAIASNNNPALTHGIAKLDTLLLDVFGDEMPDCEEECELKVLINTTKGQVIRCFAFNGNKLSILS